MPLTRRQILRRRRIVVFTAAGVLLLGAFYLPVTLLAPLNSVAVVAQAQEPAVQAPVALAWPALGASAVGAVDYPGVLGTGGSETAAPIASITKIITALVVLQEKPLALGDSGPDITFGAVDVAIREKYRAMNGKVEPVTPGTTLSQRQVMDVMLVESANNYAESLATWAFGSMDAFLPVANAWLASNSLASTSIAEPTGMSAQNVSTASDLVALGKLALANPVVSEIVGTPVETVPVVGEITNSNSLLGVAGVRGIKTGTLDEAGACLLFAADYQVGGETVTVVGAVLGGIDHKTINAQVTELLSDVQESFHDVALTTDGQSFGSYTTDWGQTVQLVAAEDASVVVWSDTAITLSVETENVGLGRKGDDVGTATYTVGDETFTVPLELGATITDPGPWWRLTNPAALL